MKTALSRYSIATGILLTALVMSAAHAQYAWIDANGVRQYSDQPPPPTIPASRILKRPNSATQSNGSLADPAQSPASDKASSTPTTAELNAEFQRRKAERADKEKKAADAEKLAADRKKNCERALNYKRVLDSGERISQANDKGERYFMTDEQRAKESRDVQQTLADCK